MVCLENLANVVNALRANTVPYVEPKLPLPDLEETKNSAALLMAAISFLSAFNIANIANTVVSTFKETPPERVIE